MIPTGEPCWCVCQRVTVGEVRSAAANAGVPCGLTGDDGDTFILTSYPRPTKESLVAMVLTLAAVPED